MFGFKINVTQASELQGCMFPGSPLPHPDIDQWKHTMFTNVHLYFMYMSCQNHTGNIQKVVKSGYHLFKCGTKIIYIHIYP